MFKTSTKQTWYWKSAIVQLKPRLFTMCSISYSGLEVRFIGWKSIEVDDDLPVDFLQLCTEMFLQCYLKSLRRKEKGSPQCKNLRYFVFFLLACSEDLFLCNGLLALFFFFILVLCHLWQVLTLGMSHEPYYYNKNYY